MPNPRPISTLLSPSEQLLRHSRLLLKLQSQLEALIEPGLVGHFRIQNLRDGILLLQTDTPVWANRLRYTLPSLLNRLRSLPGLEQLRNIHVSVVAPVTPPPRPTHTPRISAATARLIYDTANATSDPELQEALRRLARNTSDSN